MQQFLNNVIDHITKSGINLTSNTPIGMSAQFLYEMLGGDNQSVSNNMSDIYNLYTDWRNSGDIENEQGFIEKLGTQLQGMGSQQAQSVQDLLSSTTGQQAVSNAEMVNPYFSSQNLSEFNQNSDFLNKVRNVV